MENQTQELNTTVPLLAWFYECVNILERTRPSAIGELGVSVDLGWHTANQLKQIRFAFIKSKLITSDYLVPMPVLLQYPTGVNWDNHKDQMRSEIIAFSQYDLPEGMALFKTRILLAAIDAFVIISALHKGVKFDDIKDDELFGLGLVRYKGL